jgi:hypothetical protein
MIFSEATDMSQVVLVHPLQTFTVSARLVVLKCNLFTDNPSLTSSLYTGGVAGFRRRLRGIRFGAGWQCC